MEVKYGSFLTKFSQSRSSTDLRHVRVLSDQEVDFLNSFLPIILKIEKASDLAGSVVATFFRAKSDIEVLLSYISHPLLGASTYLHSALNNEILRILNSFKVYLDHADKNVDPQFIEAAKNPMQKAA